MRECSAATLDHPFRQNVDIRGVYLGLYKIAAVDDKECANTPSMSINSTNAFHKTYYSSDGGSISQEGNIIVL